MSKQAKPSETLSKSSFKLTFVFEILNIDVFHDCNEGWLELGPSVKGIKLKYHLFAGQDFDIDVVVWPNTAKIFCGTENCWVRTFLYLERRWLAFSIRHAFPVRVDELRAFEAKVTPSFGLETLSSNAKNDKTPEVYIPKLGFGERRYFAPVMAQIDQEDQALVKFIHKIIWDALYEYIPPSFLDGKFDVPHPVTDIRHQDTAFQYIQESTFNGKHEIIEEDEQPGPDPIEETKSAKEDAKSKKTIIPINKKEFYYFLPGNAILAGIGRVVPFQKYGKPNPDMGEMAVFLSSNNLPSDDDLPILFINVEKLFDVPIAALENYRIAQLYTKWTFGQELHESEPKNIKFKNSESNTIIFKDHYAVPLNPALATEMTAIFIDDFYEIQLRGKLSPPIVRANPKFFGYDKGDKDFDKYLPPKLLREDENPPLDTLIAVTKIDAKQLAKGIPAFIRGEYPLYPPRTQVIFAEREAICTNDINGIGAPLRPTLIVPPSLILKAQMTLEVSMGIVGCKPPRLTECYSRLYCLTKDSATTMAILMKIKEINETECESKCDLLTGFVVDTGDVVVIFLEGPRYGKVLHVWEQTADYYPKVKPIFSSSARYSQRVYPELVKAAVPFLIVKMFVPLPATLACPPVYAKPALPLPTKSAVLKLGRLITRNLLSMPGRADLPTYAELQSFRLELCAPTRPPGTTHLDNINITSLNQDMQQACVFESQKNQQAGGKVRIESVQNN